MKRILFIMAILTFSLSMTVFAEERRSLDGNGARRWEVMNEDYLPKKNEWHHNYDGAWVYLDDEGYTLKNTWFCDPADGKWYYFDEYCYMLHDTTTPDGYQVGSDGAWIAETGMPVDTLVWIGTYKADDGQTITVKSADGNGINVVFNGYSEEGDYTQEYTLPFVDAAKKQAVYNEPQFDQRDIYTLTETGIEVKVEPSGGWKQGTYVKQ